jgi:phage tail sheath protein FI
MATYKTPDVYIEEIPVFPPSVAEVGTAIPAFIGYTEKAKKTSDNDLRLKPIKIYSFAEFEQYFGAPVLQQITVALTADPLEPSGFKSVYTLGTTKIPPPTPIPTPTPTATPTSTATPTATPTATATSTATPTATATPTPTATPSPVPVSAGTPGTTPIYFLYWSVKQYFDNGGGQCYIVSVGSYDDAIALGNSATGLQAGLEKVALEDEPTLLVIPEATRLTFADYKQLAQKMLNQCGDLMDRFAILDVWAGYIGIADDVSDAGTPKQLIVANRDAWGQNLKYGAAYYPFLKTAYSDYLHPTNHNLSVTVGGVAQTADTKAFNAGKAAVQDHFIVLPPSGAVAGAYAAVDGARGVWKAPANVALASVLEPVIKIDNVKQAGLNVDETSGKSINVLRAFAGKGTLVWGARTLLGNDNEWRYIPVRRFFNMVEESVKKSTYWAVFEPNDANLWVKVRGMIENYLIDKWREGALAGALPKDAFYVKCGLGTTMSAQDILAGRLHVEIGMAVVRPAEFIVLKFFHKLQTS